MQHKLSETHALRIQRTLAQQDALKGQFDALHQRCIVEQLAAVGEASGKFVDLKNVKFDLENLTITVEEPAPEAALSPDGTNSISAP